jgi:LysM domain
MSRRHAHPMDRVGAMLLLLIGIRLALDALGRGPMAGPDRWSADGLEVWLRNATNTEAALAIVRMLALGCWWYLTVATLVGVVLLAREAARGPGSDIRECVRRLPGLSTLLRWFASAGVGVGVIAATAPAASAQAPPPPPVLRPQGSGSTLAALPPPTLSRPSSPEPAPEPPGHSIPPATSTRVVQPGDSLWRIAETILADHWGRPVSDPEVAPFWIALIERNRARLLEPDDPDLIYAGQVLDLPDPPDLPNRQDTEGRRG